MKTLLLILISTALVNNFVFSRFIGLCPVMGLSTRISTSAGMGMAVIFVITVASTLTWALDRYLLRPLDLLFLQTIAFILVIAFLVQLVEMFLKKTSPALYRALGIYLPLITTNCAVLAVSLLTVRGDPLSLPHPMSLPETLAFAVGTASGFTLALLLMAGIRERFETADIPRPFRGMAAAFITAGILALAFLGFSGMVRM